ncbi:MAG: START-like domain-containing protein [Flavobacteriales bacterium]|nr:START-like domain-containing protein [Flavobacteriales bacterium]MCX7649504.1 START-like domain-containing protein [Flavobacteriales bacterium]MDW8431791.1 START-like domain-containing protein [Flavobacteriales bacterium]
MKKLELEFPLRSSVRILYGKLATANGLQEWFADKVDQKKDIFTFSWEDDTRSAQLISHKDNEYVRFKWTDDPLKESYFEFKIRVDELTGDVALMVTDFCEEEEAEDTRRLWEHQIHYLRHIIGS